MPEPSLAIDQIDLLYIQIKPVLVQGHNHVVGLRGATDQAPVGDLLDAVVLGAGYGVHFPAKVKVDAMLDHGFPKIRVASLDRQHAR